ncbi:pro-neuropeptide Y-like [Schistocerca nitens]|uniref:pro-neuropeptide Y-like n=1 Tax=Schistocerca cancellata TaxID=274614 RepID=UPI00211973A2|nr:pro-neuropeptide Y-like [Schistocerca cancellata]XP_049807158.1 pro-neuropeptide Y-like [Schistocerca nitens]XP_049846499.1 pro-neuropeptide Y-like isoform X2 [Schistocerca gregaria]UGX04223.1 neuropeptide F2 [Schistocerca gregaria]
MSLVRVVVIALVVLAATAPLSEPLPAGADAGQQRPERPPMFTSPEELRNYLTQLSDFYASLGRPRFGKRGSAAAAAFRAASRLPVPPPDAYEQLFQYDE